MADTKISPYSLPDLKNTTDDALGNYLRGIGFKQDNTKADVKLLVGYLAVIIAGATFVADYKLGWEATKGWTAVAVAAYAILNGFFTYWLWFVEAGLVFEGSKDGKKVTFHSKTLKNDPTYYIDVTTSSPSSPSTSTRQIRTPFATWFTADGYFVAKPFQQWIASSVEVVGDVDLKNALRDERDDLAAPSPPAGDIAAASLGETQATGVESAGKSAKKAKKRG
ncbi:hypothetical protein MBLNU13_g00168t1 [Cladosporium sp. NU13]